MEEKEEVFRGHLEECLKHFSNTLSLQAPKGSLKSTLVKKSVANFCGVTLNSINDWVRGDTIPAGESLIKFMCYLDMMGYRVIELERMPNVLRNFAELIGFGFFSGKQAIEFLGYGKTSRLYGILREERFIGDEKKQKMWDLWKGKKEELEKKKKEVKEKLCRLDTLPKAVLSFRKLAVVNIMKGLLMLLEEESLDRLSESELAELQQQANTIFCLSARLSALNSRLTAFEQKKEVVECLTT